MNNEKWLRKTNTQRNDLMDFLRRVPNDLYDTAEAAIELLAGSVEEPQEAEKSKAA